MKLLVNVSDKGELFEVINLSKNDKDLVITNNLIYQVFSWEVFEKIADCLDDGKKVFIPKGLEEELKTEHLIISDAENDLEAEKARTILKMRDIICNSRLILDKLSLMDFYEFVSINNWFISKGFVITEENRADIYLDIIQKATELSETDSELGEEYIKNVDKYMSVMDMMNNNKDYYEAYLDFVNRVEDSLTIEEVSEVLGNFRADFC